MHRLLTLLALLGLFTFGCAPTDSGTSGTDTEAAESAGDEGAAMTEESGEEMTEESDSGS